MNNVAARERAWLARVSGAERYSANPLQEAHATHFAAQKRYLDAMRAGSLADQAAFAPSRYYQSAHDMPAPFPLPALSWMDPFAGGNASALHPDDTSNLPTPPLGTLCDLDDATLADYVLGSALLHRQELRDVEQHLPRELRDGVPPAPSEEEDIACSAQELMARHRASCTAAHNARLTHACNGVGGLLEADCSTLGAMLGSTPNPAGNCAAENAARDGAAGYGGFGALPVASAVPLAAHIRTRKAPGRPGEAAGEFAASRSDETPAMQCRRILGGIRAAWHIDGGDDAAALVSVNPASLVPRDRLRALLYRARRELAAQSAGDATNNRAVAGGAGPAHVLATRRGGDPDDGSLDPVAWFEVDCVGAGGSGGAAGATSDGGAGSHPHWSEWARCRYPGGLVDDDDLTPSERHRVRQWNKSRAAKVAAAAARATKKKQKRKYKRLVAAYGMLEMDNQESDARRLKVLNRDEERAAACPARGPSVAAYGADVPAGTAPLAASAAPLRDGFHRALPTAGIFAPAPRVPTMRLGVCYNVWDSEELLEASVRAVRHRADYVCVVWQRVSHFGLACHPGLPGLLQRLVSAGLVDELVEFTPRTNYTKEEKMALTAPTSDQDNLGCKVTDISEHFFSELAKREIGRRYCLGRKCTHFMSMDADEFYLPEQLDNAAQEMLARNLDASACKMRYFFRRPEWELLPRDDVNHVMMICKCSWTMPLRLACPYPVLMDPTRKVYHAERFHVFTRADVEMWHFSYVRRDIRSKLKNVSNRSNFFAAELAEPRRQLAEAIAAANRGQTPGALEIARRVQMMHGVAFDRCVQSFAAAFKRWTPEQAIIHPHPHFCQHYKRVEVVPNHFGIKGGWLSSS